MDSECYNCGGSGGGPDENQTCFSCNGSGLDETRRPDTHRFVRGAEGLDEVPNELYVHPICDEIDAELSLGGTAFPARVTASERWLHDYSAKSQVDLLGSGVKLS